MVWAWGRLNEGGKIQSTGTYQIQFWTPSAKTKTAEPDAIEPWEKLDNESKVIEFGNRLRADLRITGFRRYEVYGSGIRALKPGYWWVMTASREYTLEDFRETYHTFWHNDQSIYVEVIRESGHYER